MSSDQRVTAAAAALTPGKESILIVRHLNFAYGRGELLKQILFDVSCEVRAGEIVLLEGPSGSGKTTLLTLIGGLRRVQRGSITLLGHELRDAKDELVRSLRKQIGFIFQQHNLLPFLTARQNVELAFSLWKEVSPQHARQRSLDALAHIGLAHRSDHLPSELSGGEKQRVAIARALVTDPKIVLADEPTASLDKHSGRQVVDLMQSMARSRGIPILLVTHDNRILDIADRTLHMEDGRMRGQAA